MREVFYLLSGNIDPFMDTDKFHLDMLRESGKEKPHLLIFATASGGTEWHENYLKNLSSIFSRYSCTFDIFEDPEADYTEAIKKADIIYFMGGNPYKHTKLSRFRDLFRQVPVKAGTSAGAIYLGHSTFYVQKDDYLIAVPEMLGFINLHVLAHSEIHPEEMVSDYLIYEIKIPLLKLYNQSGIKIISENSEEKAFAIMGDTKASDEKLEIIYDNKLLKAEQDCSFENRGVGNIKIVSVFFQKYSSLFCLQSSFFA